MSIINKLWNYKTSSEVRSGIKYKAINAMIIFLLLMICFTVISKATASMTIPIVETEKPNPSTINHTVTVDGVVETSHDMGVVVAESAVVTEVSVKSGDTVTEGDVLFTYDITDFNLQIAQYETQLGKINANLKESQSRNALAEQNREIAGERAQQDLAVTDVHSDLDVLLAKEQVKAANEKFKAAADALSRYNNLYSRNYGNYPTDAYSSEEYNRLLLAYNQAQSEYDTALEAQRNSSGNTPVYEEETIATSEETSSNSQQYIDNVAIDEQVNQARQKLQDAKDALDRYNGIFGDGTGDTSQSGYSREEHDRLESECRQYEIAYDEAVLAYKKVVAEKEKAILDAQRVIEDTQRSQAVDATADIARMDAKSINLKLAELYDAVKNNGEIYAPISGIVTKVNIGAGIRTTNEAALFINNAETMNFVTDISKEDKKYVNIGNVVKLRMAGETKDIQGFEISSIQPSDITGLYKVTIEIPSEYLPGTSGTAEIQQKSKSYETVVPLSALHNDASQFFILRVREIETSMGIEYYAERVDVTVIEKNETYSAVTGAVNSTDKIIISSKRLIQDGDRIRLPIED